MTLTLRPIKDESARCRGPACPIYGSNPLTQGTMVLDVKIQHINDTYNTVYCPRCTDHIVKALEVFVGKYVPAKQHPANVLVSKVKLLWGFEGPTKSFLSYCTKGVLPLNSLSPTQPTLIILNA